MKFLRSRDAHPALHAVEVETVAAEPGPKEKLGDRPCGELGCSAQTGVSCEYVDRRRRPCPTARCPEHRRVIHEEIFCPVHADQLLATDWEFATGYHPDIDNRCPLLVATVARALEDDIVAILHRVCSDLDESLVSDKVRFVLVGVNRVRTWERSWKTASPIGVGCRVAICVEERRRESLIIRVNSKPVIELPSPWDSIGAPPDDPVLEEVNQLVVMPVARVIHNWVSAQLDEVDAENGVRS